MERYLMVPEIATMRQSLIDEGIIDERFRALEQIQDAKNEDFANGAFSMFLTMIPYGVEDMEIAMQASPMNVDLLREAIRKLALRTANFGAKNLNNAVMLTKVYVDEEKINVEGVKEGIKVIKQEYVTLRARLYAYYEVPFSEFRLKSDTFIDLNSWRMDSLHQEIASMRQSLFDEGLVDDQFDVLEQYQDEENPHYLEEIFTLFFSTEAPETVADMKQAMEESPNNVFKLRDALHKLKGSSASVGAKKVNNAIILTRGHIDEEKIKNVKGVRGGMDQIKRELATLQARLTPYFELLKRVDAFPKQ
ncbi:hypothetical protein ACFE04_014881 [Oxalis oulophora]